MHSSNSTVMAAAARGAHWQQDRGGPSGIPGRPSRPRRAAAPPRLSPPGSVAKVRRPRAPPAVTAGERRQKPRRPAPFIRAGGRRDGGAQQVSREPLAPRAPARSREPAARQPGGLAASTRPDLGGKIGAGGGDWEGAGAGRSPRGCGGVSPGSALCTRSLSLVPPPLPRPGPPGQAVWAGRKRRRRRGSGRRRGQRGRGRQGRAARRRSPELPGGELRRPAPGREEGDPREGQMGAPPAAAVPHQEAAERLNSAVPVKFTISSRTDAGVHALSNAAHLDVQRRAGRPPFSPEVLADALNTHLRHPAIRILQAFRVPSHFHARHAATSRTYLYRLATGCPRPDQLPVFERSRCWALRADCLDVAAMQEAAQHLLGTHDFSAFQSAGSPAASPVRRMTAVLVAVGLGALTPAQVRVILESRDPLGRHQSRVAPAYGLFLKSVLYESLGSVPKQPCAASACTEVPDELLVPSEVSS
ncbi:tRNA pseudouridine synthase-like 1 isoform X2 [Hippopotamus amphibius kiboko]|uniref:tRNA pseudouridine synthase-like 1 isoform X2 n=1 Tax=Hippopotamus amphibius kiboko TaxID=575201 RepID=UPI002597E112|nr:tRNA pseudouridine synthase-like 1 isoform X2 [Hippopotamus amphibius kiboko]